MRFYTYTTLLVLVLLIGCATTPDTTTPETTPDTTTPETTPAEPTQPTAETTSTESELSPEEELSQIIKIPNDIKEILEKGKTKLKSYSYSYRSSKINNPYKIYIKENKIKITLPDIVNVEDGKYYNAIYMDTEEKTAEAHCISSPCNKDAGKIKSLNYDETYIETPLDWLEKVTEAKEIDRRQVEDRDAIYLETNIGKIILESYYGFLYEIEDGKNKWEFIDAVFNSVKDSDVNPS